MGQTQHWWLCWALVGNALALSENVHTRYASIDPQGESAASGVNSTSPAPLGGNATAQATGHVLNWLDYENGLLHVGDEFTTEWVPGDDSPPSAIVQAAHPNVSTANPDADWLLKSHSIMLAKGSMATIMAAAQKAGPALSVAVVGSSGNLVGKKLGAEIDKHHIVIRCNGAPTDKYEADVGKFTNISVAHEWGHQDATAANVKVSQFAIVPTEAGTNADVAKKHASHDVVISADWIEYLHDKFLSKTSTWPSTGFIALATGLALAGKGHKVSVFGFGAAECKKYYSCTGADNHNNKGTYNVNENAYHPFVEEAKARQMFESLGMLKLKSKSVLQSIKSIRK